MSHIFISYSKSNIDFARYLRALLEAEGFSVWIDEARLSASTRWWKTIEENVVGCSAFVIVMSPDAVDSDWVEREILLAEREKRPIFPVLLAGEPWSRLANIQFEDMRAGLRAKLSPGFLANLRGKTGIKVVRSRSVQFSIEQGDITRIEADVAAFKYAQNFHGADAMVGSRLIEVGLAVEDFRPTNEVGDYRYLPSGGGLMARSALFVTTPKLRHLGYKQIREFTARVLAVLAEVAPGTQHLAMTMHGPGFSLDETEALLSQFAGYRDAMLAGTFPPALNRITIIEINENRIQNTQTALDNALAEADYATKLDGAWGYHLSLPTAGDEAADEPDAIESAGKNTLRPHVFVAMPPLAEMEDLFYFGIQSPVHAHGLLCERVEYTEMTDDLLDQIKGRIETAAVVVADVTEVDPAVYLQIGYAWGKGRPVLLLARQGVSALAARGTLAYTRIKDAETAVMGALDALKAGGKL